MANKDAEALSKVDPEFEAFIKSMPPIPKLSGNIPEIRAILAERKEAMNAMQGPAPTNITEKDITVAARDGYEIPVRLYRPTSPPTSGSPLVIMFHGGGFCLGDLSGEAINGRLLAAELGAVCVNVDYRLAPEHPFPVPVYDSWDVVEWAARNAASIGADSSRGFILLGTSAGANLAIVTSHLARDKKLSPAPTGVALLIPLALNHADPPAKYAQFSTAYKQNANSLILDREAMEMMLGNYNTDLNSHLYNVFAEPASSFVGLPPTLLQVCGADPLRDDGLIYDRALKDAGVKTNLKVYPGTPHSFWSVAPGLKISKQLVRDTVDGVEWLLKQT